MKEVCRIFNITRQGYYKALRHGTNRELQEHMLVTLVKEIRRKLPRIGGKKLYHMLDEDLRAMPVKIGRDKFFEILRENGLLVQPIRRYARTTESKHRFRIYRNLIAELNINDSDTVYAADITYIRITDGFSYLFLLTDLYSRKIVGYHFSKSLSAEGAIKALLMALRGIPSSKGLIHHSDRGIQYCCNEYVELLERNQIQISMGQSGNPYDNAIAERVNGILKTEFYLSMTFNNFEDARRAVEEAIYLYNNLRPHMSIGYLTPSMKYA